MAGECMYWSDLVNRPVSVLGQGRRVGMIEDFYYDPETQSISALRIKTYLLGPHILLASAIATIDHSGVSVANENMLVDESNAGHLALMPLGNQLVGSRIVSERGRELGVVSDLWLGVSPPRALHISSFEIGPRRNRRRISAHALIRIDRETLTVVEQEVS